MKRIILLSMLGLMAFNGLQAQLYLGVKGGPNLSSLLTNGDNQFFGNDLYQYKVGPQVGIFAQARFTDKFYVQPELLWINKGASVLVDASINQRQNLSLNYFSLPLMAVFEIGPSLGVMVGPELGYLASRRFGGEPVVSLITYRSWDLSLNAGAMMDLSEVLFLDLRFSFGLFGLEKFSTANNPLQSRNSSMQLSLGYMLSQD